jgi:hypothetical protein
MNGVGFGESGSGLHRRIATAKQEPKTGDSRERETPA